MTRESESNRLFPYKLLVNTMLIDVWKARSSTPKMFNGKAKKTERRLRECALAGVVLVLVVVGVVLAGALALVIAAFVVTGGFPAGLAA